MVRATLRGRCPRCGEGPLFGGPFALRNACDACGLPFGAGPGEWLGPTVIAYGLGVAAAALGGIALVRRFAFFPGLAATLVGIAAVTALAVFRAAKGFWIWLLWHTGHLPPPPDGRDLDA